MKHCEYIITDSGGIQEEACSFKKKVIVLRKETERREAIDKGYGILVRKMDKNHILQQITTFVKENVIFKAKPYGSGNAADKIIKIIKNPINLPKKSKPVHKKIKTTIAVALDTSFNFYYQDNLEALQREGANLKFFSPIKDKKIPKCDGLYIGGGFPEVLGNLLEKNQTMKKTIKQLAEDNLPIYAECGGLMYLTKSIISHNKKHKMVGIFDAETKMTNKMRLNYRKGKITAKTILSEKPHIFQGHEFHYSQLDSVSPDSKFAYDLEIGEGIKKHQDGMMLYNTLASYGHLYFDSFNYAQIFVKNCLNYSRR